MNPASKRYSSHVSHICRGSEIVEMKLWKSLKAITQHQRLRGKINKKQVRGSCGIRRQKSRHSTMGKTNWPPFVDVRRFDDYDDETTSRL